MHCDCRSSSSLSLNRNTTMPQVLSKQSLHEGGSLDLHNIPRCKAFDLFRLGFKIRTSFMTLWCFRCLYILAGIINSIFLSKMKIIHSIMYLFIIGREGGEHRRPITKANSKHWKEDGTECGNRSKRSSYCLD